MLAGATQYIVFMLVIVTLISFYCAGGGESFADKRAHFYSSLKTEHADSGSSTVNVEIKRDDLVESVRDGC